jgi:hypothetical protein
MLGFSAAILFGLASFHIPPQCHLEVALLPDHLDVQVLVWAQVFEEWFQEVSIDVEHLSTEQFAALAMRVEQTLAARLRIQVDGITVSPKLVQVRYRKGTESTDLIPYVMLRLNYGVKSEPRKVGITWVDWTVIKALNADKVQTLLAMPPNNTVEIANLTEEEPEHLWHSPAPRVVAAKFEQLKPRVLKVPLATLACLLLLPLVQVLPALRGRMRVKGGLTLGVLVASMGLLFVPPVTIPLDSKTKRPNVDQAALIFEDLLKNVYRAFDYDHESEIYDTLERSVTPEVLDGLYNQVYQSLVLRDEGGAVSKPTAVSIEEVTVIPSSDPEAADYRVRARWVVQGTVSHMGHRHIRTNRHQAIYNVVPTGENEWRIGAAEVLSQVKVGDDIGVFGTIGDPK